jgi:carboxypeptidase family protein/TonB-dependent receptor-like protein
MNATERSVSRGASSAARIRGIGRSRHIRAAAVALSLCCMCLAIVANPVFGQTDQGAITGIVSDPSGGAIPNAQVTLKSADTGLVLSARTDQSGVYTFSPVKIGNYTISVTANGFATTTQENLQLHLQQQLEVDLKLTLGQVSQQVEVTAAPPVMQTEDASVGQEFSTSAINDTPLNGRNYVYIAQLAAGVVPTGTTRGGGTGDFSANGQSNTQNNFMLNGVDNNVDVVDYLNQASYTVRPPPDALSEFRVSTADYSAEFGHSSGSVVNAAIKSGTNQIHGDVWEYFRNTVLDAKDWDFTSIPPYHENQFGATLGGPIIKNKVFLFGDLENNRVAGVDSANNTFEVPTAKMRTGDFSELLSPSWSGSSAIQLYEPGTGVAIANNRLDLDPNLHLNAAALNVLSLYPCPNAPAVSANNCTVVRPITDNTFSYDTRLDWDLSSKDQMFWSFSDSLRKQYHTPPLGTTLDGGNFYDTGNSSFLGQSTAVSYTHIFAPTLTNEFRVGYNYGHFTLRQVNAGKNISTQLGFGGIPMWTPLEGGLVQVTMSGMAQFGGWQWMYTTEHQNIIQVLDNVTKILGNHALKFGVGLQYIRYSTVQPMTPHGQYTFNGLYTGTQTGSANGFALADFLLNKINTAQLSGYAGTDELRWDNAVYAEDNWKATRRLALTLGVRWEDPTPVRELQGHQANLVPTSALGPNSGTATYLIPNQRNGQPANLGPNFATIAGPRITVAYTPNQYEVNQAPFNFAPRLGLAYKLTDRAVVRVGYGIFFGGLSPIGYGPNPGADFPFLPTSSFVAGSCKSPANCPVATSNLGNPLSLVTGFVDALNTGIVAAVTSPTINGTAVNTKQSYSENYNLSAEYSITHNIAATLGYVGTQSHHSEGGYNLNNTYDVLKTGSVTACTPANQATCSQTTPFPFLGSMSIASFYGQAAYNSLQATLTSHASKGLTFAANYTWSHQMSIGSPSSPILLGLGLTKVNATGSMSSRFTFNGNYELPFGKGQRFANNSRLLDYAIGGWASSLTVIAQNGSPFTIGTASINNKAGTPNWQAPVGASPPAIQVGNPFAAGGTPPGENPITTSCPTTVHTRAHWYNPCAFADPASANGLNVPAGGLTGSAALPFFGAFKSPQVYGPGYNRVNVSLFKDFTIRENKKIEFRTDAFNLFNHPSWANPSTGMTASAGQITAPVAFQANTPDARFFQFSLKLLF